MNLIIPKKLERWDTIWIISPSAWLCPIFPHRVDNWINMLKKLWFNVKFASNSKNNDWYVSWTVQQRVDDIHEMFLDKNVKAIICTVWWNHSNQLLKKIDYEIIKNNPKVFVWYSDITVLHYAFYNKAKLQTYYWPCLITEFWEYPEMFEYSRKYFLKTLTEWGKISIDKINYYTDELLNWLNKEDLKRQRKVYNIDWFKWIRRGYVKSKIIWWCVPSVNHLIWTEYWIDPEDKVYFIDLPEWSEIWKWISISNLDSYLTDLDNINLFDKISWLIVSVPYWYDDNEKEKLYELIKKFVNKKDYPVLLNFPIWHTEPMITLPLMSEIEFDSNTEQLIIYN